MSLLRKLYASDPDTGNSAGVTVDGNTNSLNVSNGNSEGLLTDILKQLKIMNLHLSIITDNSITEQEVE